MKIIILTTLLSTSIFAGHIVKKRITMPSKRFKVIDAYSIDMGNQPKRLKRIRESIDEKNTTANIWYEETYYPTPLPLRFQQHFSNFSGSNPRSDFPGHEVKALVKQGPDKNRIILTILGDGYTHAEKRKFFSDANRIVKDLFGEVTFYSYLKLFNIYAIFTPSKESGISDIKKKNTTFGLYRAPKGSKRGVMPGNRSRIERALKLTGVHVDYPVIIANDDYYGGLGGRYAITTRSLTSGSMVLRHELGHNFSNVGEEYDGGQVYQGANFSSTTNVKWKHWLNQAAQGPFHHQALHGNYVWKNLSAGESTGLTFHSDDPMAYEAVISAVGWNKANDLRVELDGRLLELSGVLSKDRSFFKSKSLIPLAPGQHRLKVTNQSSHLVTLAFARGNGYPANYSFEKNLVSAFSVYRTGRRFAGYRPTHSMCLMRDMRSKHFCPVDQENIWLRFLDRLNLIDSFKIENTLVSISTLPIPRSMTSVRWLKQKPNGKWFELDQMYNYKKVVLSPGKYQLRAYFNHPELKKNDDRRRELVEFEIK